MGDHDDATIAAATVPASLPGSDRAKHLPLLPLTGAPPSLVPARMVNEVLYCERLAYLEWVQGEFADNFFTVEGRAVAHRRVDAKRDAPPPPEEERPWKARSVWLSSESLGLTAKIDIVEADGEGCVAPVEYKRGRRPKVPEGAWPPERAQLCAQVLLLREHGYRCEEAWILYAQSREKVNIAITEDLIAMTLAAITRVRALATEPEIPPPLEDDPKCRGCSLVSLCLPDEVHLLRGERAAKARPLHATRDDRAALYVQDQGARLTVRKDRLVAELRSGEKTEIRIPNTSQVCIFGNVQVTTQAIRALLGQSIPLAFFTTGGWYLGRTITNDTNNVELRMAQFRACTDSLRRLKLAQTVVRNKIMNQRTLLRRNHRDIAPTILKELKHLARKVDRATSPGELLGLEGTAARYYFGAFTGMLKGDNALETFDYNGRNRRPPKDPLNALLSLAYAILTKDWALTLQLVGFDPLLGFFHEPRFGRPALALDLLEPFRPLVADSVVVSAINNGEVTASDFILSPVGCALTKSGRQRFIAAYERRLAQPITHPVFDYKLSYRRTFEVQARLLGRHLLGEIDHYPEFRTR
jgi:CRISP-associated protein Cas1